MTLFLGIWLTPALAQVEGTYEVTVNKKQEEKDKNRWTLAEWLSQKQRNQQMDLWLAMHSSHASPYEGFVEGYSLNYDESDGRSSPRPVNHDTYGGSAAAYASIAGVRGGYETDAEQRNLWWGSFNLRVLGHSIQDTHVNLEGGIQGLTEKANVPEEYVQNKFAGVTSDLYLTKKFGLEGSYHYIFPAVSNIQRTVDGENETGGVFIEFGPVRLYGEWRREFLHFSETGQPGASEFRDGWGGGLRIYF